MTTRRKGGISLGSAIELEQRLPLDAKSLVRTKEEQLDPESFLYGYNGMVISNRAEQRVYMLTNQDATSEEASWKLIGPYDDSPLIERITALEQGNGGNGGQGQQEGAQVFMAEYGVTTAQELMDYLATAPVAPFIVKKGDEHHTAFFAFKRDDETVLVRTFGTNKGKYLVFQYAVTGNVWASSPWAIQEKLESGTTLKTVNGESLLGSGNIAVAPDSAYEVCVNDVGGNVVQIGTLKEGEEQYNIYQFYYRTDALANNAAKDHSFANLLADYTIKDFLDATGITNNGIFVGNGRTDNENRLIVQQFSKNNKNVKVRTYKDFSEDTALLKIQFIGTKNAEATP